MHKCTSLTLSLYHCGDPIPSRLEQVWTGNTQWKLKEHLAGPWSKLWVTYGGIRRYSEWGPCGREEWKDPSFPRENLQLWAVLGCFVGRAETPDEYRTRLLGIRARFGDESTTSHNCPAPLLSIIKESGEQGCLVARPQSDTQSPSLRRSGTCQESA